MTLQTHNNDRFATQHLHISRSSVPIAHPLKTSAAALVNTMRRRANWGLGTLETVVVVVVLALAVCGVGELYQVPVAVLQKSRLTPASEFTIGPRALPRAAPPEQRTQLIIFVTGLRTRIKLIGSEPSDRKDGWNGECRSNSSVAVVAHSLPLGHLARPPQHVSMNCCP